MQQRDQHEREPKYFMVRAVKGAYPPQVKHSTLQEAMEEAHRLAEKIGRPCTVLESVTRVEIADGKPMWIDVRP